MRIAVCCSSSDNIDKRYLESSKKLLEQIFRRDNDLVFGAMNNGIMGLSYQTAKKYNRTVTGIAPEIYKDDFKSLDCDHEILTQSVNDRTEALVNNSDILLFLPGGIGTIYELISAIEMKRSKEFDKPIIVYNETGFFDDFIKMLNEVYRNRFTSPNVRTSYNVSNDYMSVLDLLAKSNLDRESDLER